MSEANALASVAPTLHSAVLLPRPVSECPWIQPLTPSPLGIPQSKWEEGIGCLMVVSGFVGFFLILDYILQVVAGVSPEQKSKTNPIAIISVVLFGISILFFSFRMYEGRIWSAKSKFDAYAHTLIQMDHHLTLSNLPNTSSLTTLDFGHYTRNNQLLANHVILRSLRVQVWTLRSELSKPTNNLRDLSRMVETLQRVENNILWKESLVMVANMNQATVKLEELLK